MGEFPQKKGGGEGSNPGGNYEYITISDSGPESPVKAPDLKKLKR